MGILSADATTAVPRLLQLLRNPQNHRVVRVEAARALSYIRVDANQVIPALTTVAMNKNEEQSVREVAVKAIGEFGADAKNAVEPLVGILKDPNEVFYFRNLVFDTLSEMGSTAQAAIPTLMALLDDQNYVALRLRNKFQGQTLNAELNGTVSKSPSFREQAALALAGIGSAAAPELIAALQSPNEKVRYSAAFALGKIQPPATNAVEPLTAIMNNPKENPNIRWMAASALEAMRQDTKGFFLQNPRKSPNTLARQGCPSGEVFKEYLGQCVQAPAEPSGGGRDVSERFLQGRR